MVGGDDDVGVDVVALVGVGAALLPVTRRAPGDDGGDIAFVDDGARRALVIAAALTVAYWRAGGSSGGGMP